MDRSKWDICFYDSFGIKVARADHTNAVLISQQRQQNVLLERIIMVVVSVYELCNVAFSNRDYKLMDLDIYIGNDGSFSPH